MQDAAVGMRVAFEAHDRAFKANDAAIAAALIANQAAIDLVHVINRDHGDTPT